VKAYSSETVLFHKTRKIAVGSDQLTKGLLI
jgi:hypothetical protein